MFQTEQRLRGKTAAEHTIPRGWLYKWWTGFHQGALLRDVQGSPDFEGPWAKQPEPELSPIKWG